MGEDWLSDTRMSYDADVTGYVEKVRGLLDSNPYLRTSLALFAELVRDAGDGLVADVGCGPGYVTRHLQDLGVDGFGVDLSAQMVALAQREYPDLRFEVGTMTDLGWDDCSIAGIVAFWSIVHVPDQAVPGVFEQFRRVWRPGSPLLIGFHAGRGSPYGQGLHRTSDQPGQLPAGAGRDLRLAARGWIRHRGGARLAARRGRPWCHRHRSQARLIQSSPWTKPGRWNSSSALDVAPATFRWKRGGLMPDAELMTDVTGRQTPTEAPHAPELPDLTIQAERLIGLGLLDETADVLDADQLRDAASRLQKRCQARALLVVSDRVVPPSALVPRLRRPADGPLDREKAGFVVVDMVDIDDFVPTPATAVPDDLVYAIEDPDRGDAMRNWSPAEAEEWLLERGRTPFTITEGVHWALQAPAVIDRNACYMMIGSRLPKAKGYDARTPALWISNGTGRDGRERRDAPKLGWCWWNNRHTWLGFASGSRRVA